MATFEQVEKLREKAKVTYDEAKNALEIAGGDMLEAMIYLEKQGKVEPPANGGFYSTKNSETENKSKKEYEEQNNSTAGITFGQLVRKFFGFLRHLIAKGNANTFEVIKNEKVVVSIPVTVLVILLIFMFGIVVPLIIIGLFFNYRYVFKGPDIEKTGVNKIMDKAADTAENIKNDNY